MGKGTASSKLVRCRLVTLRLWEMHINYALQVQAGFSVRAAVKDALQVVVSSMIMLHDAPCVSSVTQI